jgi:hypothetical protein
MSRTVPGLERSFRITVSGWQMELLIESIESRRNKILDECLQVGISAQDLAEGMNIIRDLNGMLTKYTAMVMNREVRDNPDEG